MKTPPIPEQSEFKSGFVAIVGRPNVGKSTLLNYLAQRKIAIVSDKPQTTRHQIRAVINAPGVQAIFIDTPGLHKSKDHLGERMNRSVRSALAETDGVVFMVDVADGVGGGDRYVASELAKLGRPVIVAPNKVDAAPAAHVARQLELVGELVPAEWPIVAVSALKGDGMADLLVSVVDLLPLGPQYYPDGMITDQPEAVVIAEFIREKALQLTREEVPHAVAVAVDHLAKREDKEIVDVAATIYVERDSQKGILIGKGGQMLKTIGSRARRDIEALLGSQIYLDLRVRVKKDWRSRDDLLNTMGYGLG